MTNNVYERLEELGRELKRANEVRDEVMVRMKGAIRAAAREGVPKEHIQRATGVAKQTVYDALDE